MKYREGNAESNQTVLVLGSFERVGSTWFMASVDEIGRGYTEIFRQHLGPGHPFSSIDKIAEGSERGYFDKKLKGDVFGQLWLRNFKKWQNFPDLCAFKETNLFLTLGSFLSFFDNSTPVVLLTRDPRGIFGSFKRSNLYERWSYEERFNDLKKIIVEKKHPYEWIFETTDKKNWLDVLISLLLVNNLEISKSVLDNRQRNKIFKLNYEEMVVNGEKLVKKLSKFIGRKLMTANDGKEVKSGSEFNIYKKKKNPNDWVRVISKKEADFIQSRIAERMSDVEAHFGRNAVKDLLWLGFDMRSIDPNEFEKRKKRKLRKQKYKFEKADISRDEIIEKLHFSNVNGGRFLMGRRSDKRCGRTVEMKIDNFKLATTAVSNVCFAAFLNWMSHSGVDNEIAGNYLFIDTFMPAERGGRIFKTNNDYKVLSGFEDHPVNWVNYLGATAFARWLGYRLMTEAEWEYVAKMSEDMGGDNLSFRSGDTCEVDGGGKNSLGIYQWWGNVRTWCSDWYYPGYTKPDLYLMKSIRGGSWNSKKPAPYERNYKPFMIGARSTGIRLVEDKGGKMSKELAGKFGKFVRKKEWLNISINLVNKELAGFFEIN